MDRMVAYFSLVAFLIAESAFAQSTKTRADERLARAIAAAQQRSTNGYGVEFLEFVESRQQRAHSIAEQANSEIDPRVSKFFQAMTRLDFPESEKIYATAKNEVQPWGISATMHECIAFYPLYGNIPPDRLEALTKAMVEAIPDGAIYFSGTNPGCLLPTWHAEVLNPNAGYFTIALNKLPDGTFVKYLHAWHGDSITLPSQKTVEEVFRNYVEDARNRYLHDQNNPKAPRQVKPGENISIHPKHHRTSISGKAAVMTIAGGIAQEIFKLNPDREFYVEAGLSIEWMYPHLRPHGMLLKLEHKPVSALTDDEINRDREHWKQRTDKLLGNWLKKDTSVAEIGKFIQQVHRDRNYKEFEGNPVFVKNVELQKIYSKLRTASAGLYSWHFQEAHTRGDATAATRMKQEADFAFRQAWALQPTNNELAFRYAQLLANEKRHEEASLIIRISAELEHKSEQIENLQKTHKR